MAFRFIDNFSRICVGRYVSQKVIENLYLYSTASPDLVRDVLCSFDTPIPSLHSFHVKTGAAHGADHGSIMDRWRAPPDRAEQAPLVFYHGKIRAWVQEMGMCRAIL